MLAVLFNFCNSNVEVFIDCLNFCTIQIKKYFFKFVACQRSYLNICKFKFFYIYFELLDQLN